MYTHAISNIPCPLQVPRRSFLSRWWPFKLFSRTPSSETDIPSTETDIPSTETDVPSTETDVPSTETYVKTKLRYIVNSQPDL